MKVMFDKIGLGSVQFGLNYGIANTEGQTTPKEVIEILNHAKAQKIKYIDTASAYGNSEEVLGATDLSEFRMVSKFKRFNGEAALTKELENSLQRLQVKQLYGYLAHRPEFLIDNKQAWSQLLNLKEQGKVKKIGFSLNHTDELLKLLSLNMFPDLIQVPYNFFDQRFEALMIRLKDKGCEIHTRSTFLQGLFFVDSKQLSSFFEPVKAVLEKMQATYQENLSGALIKYVLEKEFVDVLIMGVNNLQQLQQNLARIKSVKPISIKLPEIPERILVPSLWP